MTTRRNLLRNAAVLGVLGSFAGCIADSASGGSQSSKDQSTTQHPTATPAETTRQTTRSADSSTNQGNVNDAFLDQVQHDKPQRFVAVNDTGIIAEKDIDSPTTTPPNGSTATETAASTTRGASSGTSGSSEPMSSGFIYIRNDSDETRQIAVTITLVAQSDAVRDQETDTGSVPNDPIVQKTYSIDPDAFMGIVVTNPGEYEISARVGQHPTKTMTFTADRCDSHTLLIEAMTDGSIKSSAATTMVGCENDATNATTRPGDARTES